MIEDGDKFIDNTINKDIKSLLHNGIPKCNGDTNSISSNNEQIENQPLYIFDMPTLTEHQLVIWRHPITTLKYCFYELSYESIKIFKRLKKNRIKVLLLFIFFICLLFMYNMPGPHQKYLIKSKHKILWCIYWIGLGILSSIGLGTGLHTFVLYLGPHIAAVTIAAYECNTLKFPEPPYPDEIICPSEDITQSLSNGYISMWSIMRKVYLEAFMWGAGTALGELPPYFMAKAARSSGSIPLDEDYEEFEELLEQSANMELTNLGYLDRVKIFMQNLVQNVGFTGILLCASIPNPLFDFAGITCGHFMVPFWTFFGATLIGKAIVKVHIQELFVIIAFSEHHVDRLVSMMKYIPIIGKYLQAPFKEYLNAQKAKLHRSRKKAPMQTTWLAWCFEKLLIFMILYFIVSIINSMAQKYRMRLLNSRKHK